jgi:RimJ/RimL family protein N-acetyltransferase
VRGEERLVVAHDRGLLLELLRHDLERVDEFGERDVLAIRKRIGDHRSIDARFLDARVLAIGRTDGRRRAQIVARRDLERPRAGRRLRGAARSQEQHACEAEPRHGGFGRSSPTEGFPRYTRRDMSRRLKTARLELVTATLQHVLIGLEDPTKLARLLGADLADAWPPRHANRSDLEALRDRLHKDPSAVDWGLRLVLRRDVEGRKPILVGAVTLSGAPDDGLTEIACGFAGEHAEPQLIAEALHAVMDWAFKDETLERMVAIGGLDGGVHNDLLLELRFTSAGAGDAAGTSRFVKLRETWLEEGPPSRRCPPLRAKDASEPIRGLPPVAKDVFLRFVDEPLRSMDEVRQEVRQYVASIEQAAENNPYIDDILARDIARVLGGLMDAVTEDTPELARRQIQAAARYFVTEEDGDSDLAIGGLDEDAAVANAVADHLGRDDLVSDMV